MNNTNNMNISYAVTNPLYLGQYYVPSCIPPYLISFYVKAYPITSVNYDTYYPPYMPC